MKNVFIVIINLLIISCLLFQGALSESDMRHCYNRDDLKLLTGVPTTGIQIERIDAMNRNANSG